MTKQHKKYMKIALDLAAKGNPSPNPYVGCVVVKDKKILCKGYHTKCGKSHAEVEAINHFISGAKIEKLQNQKKKKKTSIKKIKINKALRKDQLRGSTIYITLEPCTHYGRTPPCVDKIIDVKPKEVVIAMLDPNKRICGRGVKKLREAGINVIIGILEEEAKKLNKTYVQYVTTGKPFVFMKSAMTMNWKITWGDGRNKQITGDKSNEFVHELRNKVDAILVGINTIMRDNPQLTTRLEGKETKNPIRVILDSKLKIPLSSNVLRDNNVIIITGKQNRISSKKKNYLRSKGIKVFVFKEERISIKKAIWVLGKLGISSVLIEGGARINTSALKAEIVDEIFFLVAPFIVNDKNSLGVFSNNAGNLHFKKISINKLGKDFIVNAVPRY